MPWNCNVHATASLLEALAQLNRPFSHSHSHIGFLGVSK